jgi:Domain of unknown function (DUF1906)/Putative peptidoglycan binding domain
MTGYMPVPGTDFDPAEHPPAPGDHPLLVAADQAGAAQYGFDYAWQSDSPAQLVSLLKANQAQFVARYINDPGGKGITAAEAAALEAAGITICPVYETTGADFTGGYNAGVTAGRNAAADMHARGALAGSLCWLAIDTGTSDFGSTNAYLKGAKAGTGGYIAQLYGSYDVCEAAASSGLGSLHWQTYAWSAGKVSRHALLYQYQNAVSVGGISMDRDRTLQAMSGPWAHSGSAPKPPPPVTPPSATTVKVTLTLPVLKQGAKDAAGQPFLVGRMQAMVGYVGGIKSIDAATGLSADGNFGASTTAAVKAVQKSFGLPQDGVVGAATWGVLYQAKAV